MAFLKRQLRRALLAATLALAAAPSCQAALQEYQVKAVFLFNFTQFIDWPATTFRDAATPITICILGDDPFGSFLDDAVHGERVGNRTLVVRRLGHGDDVAGCQIAFISSSESARLDETIRHLDTLPVLTVSDVRGFGEHGGMVAFVTADNHVRLRINLDAVRTVGLSVSSKLLRVAEVVGHPP